MARKLPLSLAERDRRWAKVRELMAGDGIDYLIGFPNSGHWGGFQAEIGYLTPGITEDAGLVFPLEGEPTAFTSNEGGAEDWKEAQDWFSDIHSAGRRWGDRIVRNLQQRGFQRGKLGVLGLDNVLRAPDGVVAWGSVQTLHEKLPGSTVVSATDLVMSLRMYKSEEEVELIRQADRLAEQAAAEMVATAADPEATGAEVRARIRYTLERNGSDPSMVLFHAGPPDHLHVPSTDPLEPGDILINEIEGRVWGYCAQACQPVAIGPNVPQRWRDNFAVNLECWQLVADRMRPGVRLGDVWQAYLDFLKQRGYEPTGWIMHCRGLGEDKPGLHPGTREYDDWTFERNQTFILKPSVLDPTIGTALRFGDTVVVTDQGAQRLGTRKPELSIVRA